MIRDIYASFRALPVWVQVWVALILVPVNAAALLFITEPSGVWIAILAVGAMLPNLGVMAYDRGFSKLMALPHLLPWSVLVSWLLFFRPEAFGAYAIYLWVLLAIDAVSLGFDFPDAGKWIKGDRAVAEHS
ncbi:MAG: hypothetical protein JKY31_08260 [Rhodobacteraceae bacterium]|nr:hypothetical protein [Paracoccaceae bacterium]